MLQNDVLQFEKCRGTYQRLVNKICADLISKMMEVYVNDMLIKSLKADDHVMHLNKTFQILRRYRMRPNPLKCAFGVASKKFLGYMDNQWGIELRPKKICALIEMRSSQNLKEVHSLTSRMVVLSCFISKATDKSSPFFKVLKGERCSNGQRSVKRPSRALKGT